MYKLDLETWSQCQQDLFAYLMVETGCFLKKPATRKFLDLGCRFLEDNNTYKLELLGWEGLLFDNYTEIDLDKEPVTISEFNNENRSSKFFCVDVTTDEFCDVLLNNPEYLDVDYISLDVDRAGLQTLENLFKMGVRFKCITFEHDKCSFGDTIKKPSEIMFREQGYELLFDDVGCNGLNWPLGPWGKWGRNAPFEDWWIDPTYFIEDVMDFASVGERDFSIIGKLVNYISTYGVKVENNGKYNGGRLTSPEFLLDYVISY